LKGEGRERSEQGGVMAQHTPMFLQKNRNEKHPHPNPPHKGEGVYRACNDMADDDREELS
jgi:hypothetical protein